MDRDRLERIIPVLAQKHRFRQEIIEKDYYLTLILNSVESSLSDKIVFKGVEGYFRSDFWCTKLGKM